MLVEQAIFTSAVTDRAQGYQLTSRSPGISDADARELAVWGPSHDSLLEGHGATGSVNFNRLSSGAYAISRTTTGGAEYSGRGGAQVYTQFLVVSPELLARFANNPFAILRAATAVGAFFGVKALGAKGDFNDDPTTDNADAVERNALIADMAFGVAITLGVTGVVLLTSGDSEPAKEKAAKAKRLPQKARFNVAPYATPNGGGAAARFVF